MKLVLKSIAKSLTPSLKAHKPSRVVFDQFKSGFAQYLDVINHEESEENLKTHLMTFLGKLYGKEHLIEQMEQVDFVIRTGGKTSPAGVLFEHKRSSNTAEFISKADCNRKSMHELVLYYMRERSKGNTDIKHLVICSEVEFFIFQAKFFERAFFKNASFQSDYTAWANGLKSDSTTDFFYNQIAKPRIALLDSEIEATYFNLKAAKAELESGALEKQLLQLFKILGPQHLLMSALANDSNSLNKAFYDELLYIIGLEEKKESGTRIIDRLPESKRSSGSLIENTIAKLIYEDDFTSAKLIEGYGVNTDKRAFGVGLELCLTWINRLLFLKLLEAQIVKFHGGDNTYKFLNLQSVPDFDELSDLFFMVLAIPQEDRPEHIQIKFAKVPYLNSSLFEKTELEKILGVGSLNANHQLSPHGKTVLKDSKQKKLVTPLPTLGYVFDFLDSYDFGAVGGSDVQEESKTIINASVLGLIFEKINGYKEGAIFTPGYVTMHMSRQVIEKTVLEAFAKTYPQWTLNEIDDLNNQMDRSKENILSYNKIIDDLRICDPAVGSGHFLVSCLNEIIALKSRLRILADIEGKRITDYEVSVDNDELIILKSDTDEVFNYQVVNGAVPKALQSVQETIFHEKQKVIENCLFGVDINPNSVRICQLRLWIELLKNAYYRDGNGVDLETLPNIDINIKVGNSLLSRFELDQNLSLAFNKAGLTVTEYRQLVADYKASKDKAVKRQLNDRISKAKKRFENEALGNLTKKIDAEIAQLKADEAQADLFVMGEEQLSNQADKIDGIRAQIAAKEEQKTDVIQNKTFLSALEWRFEFPEVLDDKGAFLGFDIIIANPPYMRVQEIEDTQPLQKKIYESRFSTARGSYDLANLFFELSGWLANPVGHNNIFIFPHKLFNSANGEALREYLMNTRALKSLTHFGANQIFDSVLTYTCIALFNTTPSQTFQFRRYPLGSDIEISLDNDVNLVTVNLSEIASASKLYGSNQWIFFDNPEGFKVFETIYKESERLEDKLDVFVGLQTSRDILYVSRKIAENENSYTLIVNPTNKNVKPPIESKEFKVEKQFFRPFLMGGDVHRYETLTTDRLVFFPYLLDVKAAAAKLVSMKDLEVEYPLTHTFVKHYEKAFEARENGKAAQADEPFAYLRVQNLNRFDQPKLTSMEICSKHPNVALNDGGIYHSTTLYSFVKGDSTSESYEYFSAILNSNLFWWFLKMTGDTLQGDARRVKTNYVNPFPLPEKPDAAVEVQLAKLTKAMIAAKAKPGKPEKIGDLEAKINNAVYALYGLNADDVAIIERTLDPDLVLV
ncbi:MAG: Eco57I restriction-modification methylase domain-containing protein [Parasphingorhabdus sp.]|uniref:type IIG restriction enzyme/methyltransferase n=1 Tax=Parasphingorhabdus sp. TaxID=2709688 RepID=UPI003002FBB7